MISTFINLVGVHSNTINFICYILIFFGSFYVALHSRVLPKWTETSIWYLGAMSAFAAFTICIEWIFGANHPLSHFMLGKLTEILININLCVVVILLFFHTIYHDFRCRKERRTIRREEDRLTL